jgi:hypothetical protein
MSLAAPSDAHAAAQPLLPDLMLCCSDDPLSPTTPPALETVDRAQFGVSPIHGVGVFASEDIELSTKRIRDRAVWVINKATIIKGSFSASNDATGM